MGRGGVIFLPAQGQATVFTPRADISGFATWTDQTQWDAPGYTNEPTVCALCLPLQIYGSRVLGDFVLARPKKPLIWSSHLPESTLFVWSESVLGFGLTLFCVGLFLAPRGRAAYQELTLHTASIISFLDMAMSKQPRAYFTTLRHIFADTNSHLKLSLQHTHTPLWVCCVVLIENTHSLQLFSDAPPLVASVKRAWVSSEYPSDEIVMSNSNTTSFVLTQRHTLPFWLLQSCGHTLDWVAHTAHTWCFTCDTFMSVCQ